jgi:hypothetical protein
MAAAPLLPATAASACPPALDIDASTDVAVTTDGVLLLRHLLGFTGEPLVAAATGAGAARTAPAEITAYVDMLGTGDGLDVDGDGQRHPLSDGMLIARHVAGLRGTALVAGAIDPQATRQDAAAVAGFVDGIGAADADEDGSPDRCEPGGGLARYACARVLHVAPGGDDGADGSAGAPLRNIDTAVNRAVAGECVHVAAGTYREEVGFARGGTAGAPIVLYAERDAGGGHAVHIDNSTLARNALSIFHPHVVVDGFRITGYVQTQGFHAIDIQGSGSANGNHVTVRNCLVTGGHNQLKAGHTDDSLIEDNEFFGSFAHIPISITSNQRTVFRRNVFRNYDNDGNGAIQIKGGSTDVVFAGNTLRNITGTAGALALGDGCGSSCDIDPDHYAGRRLVARNNLFVDVNRALDIYGCRDCAFLHNTVVLHGTTTPPVKLASAATGGVTRQTEGADIRNNVFANLSGSLFNNRLLQVNSGTTGTVYDFNVVWNAGNALNGSDVGLGAGNVVADPAFTAADDFRPAAGSPMVDAAAASDVTDDFDGRSRPLGASADIGAFERP